MDATFYKNNVVIQKTTADKDVNFTTEQGNDVSYKIVTDKSENIIGIEKTTLLSFIDPQKLNLAVVTTVFDFELKGYGLTNVGFNSISVNVGANKPCYYKIEYYAESDMIVNVIDWKQSITGVSTENISGLKIGSVYNVTVKVKETLISDEIVSNPIRFATVQNLLLLQENINAGVTTQYILPSNVNIVIPKNSLSNTVVVLTTAYLNENLSNSNTVDEITPDEIDLEMKNSLLNSIQILDNTGTQIYP